MFYPFLTPNFTPIFPFSRDNFSSEGPAQVDPTESPSLHPKVDHGVDLDVDSSPGKEAQAKNTPTRKVDRTDFRTERSGEDGGSLGEITESPTGGDFGGNLGESGGEKGEILGEEDKEKVRFSFIFF